MTRTIKLAVIPGDGIGPEVIAQAERVLDAVLEGGDVVVERTEFKLGAERFLATGDTLPEAEQAAIAAHDAILFGAVGGVPGDPRLADANIERGLLLKLRFDFDHYANMRPCTLVPGVESTLANPGEVDFIVVREGTEGPYAGNGGRLRPGTPAEVATEVSVNTAFGIERVVRHGFETARSRPRKQLTWVHKTNVLVHAGATWQRVVGEVAAEYPEIQVDYMHIDAATIHMVQNPSRFDVIVTDNLFGDILTDLAGAIGGGIGLAASGNINPDGTFPSMFEPVHGSAPDIAGKQLADPTAAILSAALMLDHLGLADAGDRIRAAVRSDLAAAPERGDARRTTTEVGDAVIAALPARA
ncbi:3-isopropylmalate dehydrogenase [Leucobacter zeae]|nr:3-isopropylmalate dehydrogenase [Leucobacter zeae]